MKLEVGSLCGRKVMAWWQKRKMSPRLKQVEREEMQNGEKEMKEELKKEVKEEVKEAEEVFPWEVDYQLLACEGLFSEYLEMGECWIYTPSAAGWVEMITDRWREAANHIQEGIICSVIGCKKIIVA